MTTQTATRTAHEIDAHMSMIRFTQFCIATSRPVLRGREYFIPVVNMVTERPDVVILQTTELVRVVW